MWVQDTGTVTAGFRRHSHLGGLGKSGPLSRGKGELTGHVPSRGRALAQGLGRKRVEFLQVVGGEIPMKAEWVFGVRGGGDSSGPLAWRVPGVGRRARTRCRGPTPPPAAWRGDSRHACRRLISKDTEPGLYPRGRRDGPTARAPWLTSAAGTRPRTNEPITCQLAGAEEWHHQSAPRCSIECTLSPVASRPSWAQPRLALWYRLLGLGRPLRWSKRSELSYLAKLTSPTTQVSCVPAPWHALGYTAVLAGVRPDRYSPVQCESMAGSSIQTFGFCDLAVQPDPLLKYPRLFWGGVWKNGVGLGVRNRAVMSTHLWLQ